MLPRRSLNVTDVLVSRPNRTGPAGDQVGSPTTVHSELEAHYEPSSSMVRTETGAEARLTGLLFFDPIDDEGESVDILPGDFVSYTDHLGRTTTKREVLTVEPVWRGTELDHIEVGF